MRLALALIAAVVAEGDLVVVEEDKVEAIGDMVIVKEGMAEVKENMVVAGEDEGVTDDWLALTTNHQHIKYIAMII
jgi:hypothetical protein